MSALEYTGQERRVECHCQTMDHQVGCSLYRTPVTNEEIR